MAILSHPFRLAANGSVAKVDPISPQGIAEQIAVLVLTRRGERELIGGFGTSDPTFGAFDPTEVVAGITAFGPPTSIADITVAPRDDATLDVTVTFD